MPNERTILVADDDVLICTLIRNLLEHHGWSVLCGANGLEALKLSRDFDGEIALVITDVDMAPMDGIELLDHIAAERPGTPALVISGRACILDVPFLAKPFRPADFFNAVEQAIAGAKSKGQ